MAAGAVCAALVLLATWARRRRPGAEPPPAAPEQPAWRWDPFVSGSRSDRRSALRRRGYPVRVLLAEAGGQAGAARGTVLDRSTGGLAIAADVAPPAGAVLGVCPEPHSREAPWVQVRVRHCRRDGDGWVLGCQFLSPPPWNVLLLFG